MQPAMMDSCWRVTYDSRWEADEFECFRRFMLRLAERRTTTRSPVDPSIWAAPLVPLLFVLCDANLPPADEGADNEPNTFTFGFAFVGLAVGAILSNNKKNKDGDGSSIHQSPRVFMDYIRFKDDELFVGRTPLTLFQRHLTAVN